MLNAEYPIQNPQASTGNTPHVLRFLLPSAFFLACLLLYALTLSPNLLPADAGEYQVTGSLLGVAHPPGFALYTILSWLTMRLLFFLQPATAINFLSALLAALTLTLLSRAVHRLTRSRLAGICAALALGFSTTFWAQATTANVRMLTAFAVALALEGLTLYRQSLSPHSPADPQPEKNPGLSAFAISKPLALTAFALGLGVSHHGSLIFAAAVLGLYTLWLNPKILRRPWPLLLGLVPFLAWLYFPLRADAFGAPPGLATFDGFLQHILARGFRGDIFFFATPEFLPDRLRIFGNILTFQFTWPVLLLCALGGGVALYRDRAAGILLLTAFMVHTFVSMTYHSPQTVEYLLPAYVLMVALAGYAFAEIFRLITQLLSRLPRSFFTSRFSYIIFHLSFSILILLPQFLATFPSYLALAYDTSTLRYVDTLLTAAPPNSLILASWHWATPLWYAQKVASQRPDVEIRYVYPRTASLANDWVNQINANLPSRPVIITSFYPDQFNATPYRFIPLASAWQVLDRPLTAPPANLTGAQTFTSLEFLGYQFEPPAQSAKSIQAIDLTAAWRTSAPRDISFFIHLTGPDGFLYAQADVSHPAGHSDPGEILLDRYTLTPRPDTPPGDYALTAGAYLSDGTRLAEVSLPPLHIAARLTPPLTLHPLNRNFSGATLIGYDLDHTLPDSFRLYLHWKLGPQRVTVSVLDAPLDLPAGPGYLTTAHDLAPDQPASIANYQLPISNLSSLYVPLGDSILLTGASLSTRSLSSGETLTVALNFLATQVILKDYAVSVSIVGDGWKVQSDATPAGGAIPTLKWLAGSRIADRHVLTIPLNVAPGSAQVTLTVYDAFTLQSLPLLDPRLALLGSAIPLGTVEVIQP